MVSEKFEASNGLSVQWDRDETRLDVVGEECDETYWLDWDVYQALKEFFTHVRDKELGRWRDPENPSYVVYGTEDEDEVVVLDEQDPSEGAVTISRNQPEYWPDYQPIAQKYFETHPDPKPWRDATNGQLWLIRFRDFPEHDVSALVKGGKFVYNDLCHAGVSATTDSTIVDGRRVWPEGG